MRAHLKIIPVTYPVTHHGDPLPLIYSILSSGCDAALKYYPVHCAVACPYLCSALVTPASFLIVSRSGLFRYQA